METVTAVIKNFLRNGKTKNCVDSLMNIWPKMKIIVVDDSYPEYRAEMRDYYDMLQKRGHKVIFTPFDLGVSFGRNLALENVTTQYTLVGDNDFVYHDKSGVDRMRKLLDDRSDINIVCGGITENGVNLKYEGFVERIKDGAGKYYLLYTRLDHDKCKWEQHNSSQYAYVDIGFNYFLMRTKDYPKISWSPEIKVSLEHSDGFLRAKKNGLRSVYLRDAYVINDASNVGAHEDYGKFRRRFVGWRKFCENWEVDYGIDFDGARGDYTIYGDER